LHHVSDVLISGKCGSSVQFSLEDVAEPFGFHGSFKGDVLCTILDVDVYAQLKQEEILMVTV
jgi:hypothetical protein